MTTDQRILEDRIANAKDKLEHHLQLMTHHNQEALLASQLVGDLKRSLRELGDE